MKKKIAILGVTGSIGKSALDVITKEKDYFEPVLFSAHKNQKALEEVNSLWPGAEKVLSAESGGQKKLLEAVKSCGAEITINGISGAAGLEPSMAAIEAGSHLALANKESLVMAGKLLIKFAREKNVKIIPVDSEHSAVFFLLEAHGYKNLEEIILTASGGPFRNYTVEQMKKVNPSQALAHPTWNMGAKISIDSATMANKGLEVIEAARLFDISPEKIKILVHPQSIVHSMIQMKDSAVYAQLSKPDMRLPIYKALHWPFDNRDKNQLNDFGRMTFDDLTLEFYKPDFNKFPMPALAYEVLKKDGLYPCAYNAANEAAVEAFLKNRIGFLDIVAVTGYVLDRDWNSDADDILSVMEADKLAGIRASEKIKELQ